MDAMQHPEVRYGDSAAVFAVDQEGVCCVDVAEAELLFRETADPLVPACERVADDEVRRGAAKLAEEDDAAVAVGYLLVLLGVGEEVEGEAAAVDGRRRRRGHERDRAVAARV